MRVTVVRHHEEDAAGFIADAFEARGAELRFLPPYSPDLNPIEPVFPKLKTILRKAAERTVGALWDRIGIALDHFTPQDTMATLQLSREML